MTRRHLALSFVAFLSTGAAVANAQAPVDSTLDAYIANIRAIDSHAHPMRPVAAGAPADSEYDALPLDGIPGFALPRRLSLDDPIWARAQAALYHVAPSPNDSAHRAAIARASARVVAERGAGFPTWALDQAGIDIMLANRVAMGPGLATPRFRWVSFVDALMLPLDTRIEATRSPDTRLLYPREATLLARYLRDVGVTTRPPTLDKWVSDVVRPTLDRQRAAGAVAVKFEAAYLRPLDFDDPDPVLAARIYQRYARGGAPTRPDYKVLQDYLFRVIAQEAGQRGMAVQIHVLETFGSFYRSAGAAPRLLEPALNDSTLRGTRFVIVHGGWPLVQETQALLAKPNVYADISMISVVLSPTVLAEVLRRWLGEFPDKILFGTDAFDGGPEQGWEQVAWVGSTTARRALSIALTGMLRDGEIDRDRAQGLARMVLRENAMKAYALSVR